MSKILERGETGFGILIERDAGYINLANNTELLKEGVLDLTQLKPNEPIYVNCILQKWGVENKNGRIYPKEVLVPQVDQYQKAILDNSAVSEADHPECQLPDSEILTKTGWKKLKDIADDEEILTLNLEKNVIEIQKIEKKIYDDYAGEMYSFKSLNFENTVTPNHRFLLEDNKGIRFYMPAKEIYENVGGVLSSGKYKIIKKSNWSGVHNDNFKLSGVNPLILHKRIKKDLYERYTKDVYINTEDWFAFMGIYLADGHSFGTNSKKYISGYSIGITQKKNKHKVEIENLLNRLPFKYKKYVTYGEKIQYIISDARLYEYLFPLGNSESKYIPTELKQASKEHLEILFNWFSMGDGRNVKTKYKSNKISVFSTSKRLIDDLQEVLIKIGGHGNISIYQPKNRTIIDKKILVLEDGTKEIIEEKRNILSKNSKIQYNLNISSTNYIWLDKRSIKIEKVHYDGKVSCVKVANGNYYTRVNGKTHWTGNSSVVSLNNIAHMITKMWWGSGDNENVLYGKLKLIVSPGYLKFGIVSVVGDKILLYLQNDIKIGISSRGVGTLKEVNGKHIVQSDFELICFDLVASPSTPGAFLFPEKNEMDINGFSIGEMVKKNGLIVNEQQIKIVNSLNKFLL